MAKSSVKDQVSEIKNDDDAQAMLTDLEGDGSDAGLCLDDKEYVQCLELVDLMQEKINAVHTYIAGKAENPDG